MQVAIHKETNKPVSIYRLRNSLEWKGKEREEFIAPKHEVGNWLELKEKEIEEVKVCFVQRHLRKGEWVKPHFRIVTEGAESYPESEEHILAKEKIYEKAIEDKIILNVKSIKRKLSEIGQIEDITIESGVGKKRADVLIKFKEFNKIYGEGIAFEIQISPQKDTKTLKRNYDRASYGYSIVWIWDGDINKKNEYNLIPYNEAIETYQEQIKNEFNRELWDINKRKEETILEIRKEINEELKPLRIQRDIIEGKINEYINQVKDIENNLINSLEEILKEKIRNKLDTYFRDFKISEEVIKPYLKNASFIKMEELNEYSSNEIKKLKENFHEKISNVGRSIESSVSREINKKIDEITHLNIDEDIKKINELIAKKIDQAKRIDIEECSKNEIAQAIQNLEGDFKKTILDKIGLSICEKCKDPFPYESMHWIWEECEHKLVCNR